MKVSGGGSLKFTSMIYGIMLMTFFMRTLRLRYQSPRVSRRGLVACVM